MWPVMFGYQDDGGRVGGCYLSTMMAMVYNIMSSQSRSNVSRLGPKCFSHPDGRNVLDGITNPVRLGLRFYPSNCLSFFFRRSFLSQGSPLPPH